MAPNEELAGEWDLGGNVAAGETEPVTKASPRRLSQSCICFKRAWSILRVQLGLRLCAVQGLEWLISMHEVYENETATLFKTGFGDGCRAHNPSCGG